MDVPLVTIKVELFRAARLLDVWVSEQSFQIYFKFTRRGKGKSTVVNEDVRRSEKPYTYAKSDILSASLIELEGRAWR